MNRKFVVEIAGRWELGASEIWPDDEDMPDSPDIEDVLEAVSSELARGSIKQFITDWNLPPGVFVNGIEAKEQG